MPNSSIRMRLFHIGKNNYEPNLLTTSHRVDFLLCKHEGATVHVYLFFTSLLTATTLQCNVINLLSPLEESFTMLNQM